MTYQNRYSKKSKVFWTFVNRVDEDCFRYPRFFKRFTDNLQLCMLTVCKALKINS
jgi:hypothetical protein